MFFVCYRTGNIEKPDLFELDSYCIGRGGGYLQSQTNASDITPFSPIKDLFIGGIGGGSLIIKCRNMFNAGRILCNGTLHPSSVDACDKQILHEIAVCIKKWKKDFILWRHESTADMNVNIAGVGDNGKGGSICIHFMDDFQNFGEIEAKEFGSIFLNVIQNVDDDEFEMKRNKKMNLKVGNCNPFPKVRGAAKITTTMATEDLL